MIHGRRACWVPLLGQGGSVWARSQGTQGSAPLGTSAGGCAGTWQPGRPGLFMQGEVPYTHQQEISRSNKGCGDAMLADGVQGDSRSRRSELSHKGGGIRAETCRTGRGQARAFPVQGTARARALGWEGAQCVLRNGEKAQAGGLAAEGGSRDETKGRPQAGGCGASEAAGKSLGLSLRAVASPRGLDGGFHVDHICVLFNRSLAASGDRAGPVGEGKVEDALQWPEERHGRGAAGRLGV